MSSNMLDRAIAVIAPKWGAERMRSRLVLEGAGNINKRHYEAATQSRRTEGWARGSLYADSDMSAQGSLSYLRGHARDLIRNNGWARRAQRVIANNSISWGIVPKASGPQAEVAQELWRAWAGSTDCSADGRSTFASLQHLVMRSLVESGEVLIRRRYRVAPLSTTRPRGIALELVVLEADYLDANQSALESDSGGPIVSGVEFDAYGRRSGYWLFEDHPGSGRSLNQSHFVPAMDVIHVFEEERPGQTRGVSWLAAAVVPLKDLAELEDAELVKQKVAACFAAFITDTSGFGAPPGEQSTEDPLVSTLEPGMLMQLPVGKTVAFGSPPSVMVESLPERTLRRVCAALGVTYEEVSGDWSKVNFSSARMARLAHWGNVHHWQQDIIIPQLCRPVWSWFTEAAYLTGALDTSGAPANPDALPTAEWTPPPMPMLEPDKEGAAYTLLIRAGIMTLPGALREQGLDPDVHLKEIAASNKQLDALGIVLDCDPRKTTSQGMSQMYPAEQPQATLAGGNTP